MAEHGSTARYRGSKSQPACHCDLCRDAWATYMRDRRTKSTAERTKTRVIRPASNVVQMPRQTTQPAPPNGSPGEQELAVIAHLERIECVDVALIARCRKMASLLDDPERLPMWGMVCRQLDNMMTRAETKKKKKGGPRLAAIQAMSGYRAEKTGL
jgi:hypothetical protein